MDEDEKMVEHSRSDIWNRLATQGEQITDIAKAQASTETELAALKSAVDTGFRSLSSELRSISDKVNAPPDAPNYTGWLVGILGLLGMFGGYTLLINQPVVNQLTRVERSLDQLHELRARISALEKAEQYQREDVKTLKDHHYDEHE